MGGPPLTAPTGAPEMLLPPATVEAATPAPLAPPPIRPRAPAPLLGVRARMATKVDSAERGPVTGIAPTIQRVGEKPLLDLPLPIAPRPPPTAPTTTRQRPLPLAPAVIQRVETSAAGDTAAPDHIGTAATAVTSTGSGTPAGSTGSGPAPEGNTGGVASPNPSNLELDRLAAQLYDRVAARLRAELRLDRERAGLLTDIRR
jgi:hypothetical protein